MNKRTILHRFFAWEKELPNVAFLRQPQDSIWKEYTWSEVGKKARQIVGAFQEMGLEKGDRVAILSANCAQWFICDIAMMMAGLISVPLYANVNASTMRKILDHSGARLLLIGKLQDKDWQALKDKFTENVQLVSMEGFDKVGTMDWSEFIKLSLEQRIVSPEPEDVYTIIYTSGTTGDPKGVVHTHKSVVNAVETASEEVKLNRKGNRFISYLPLSHAAERGLIEAGGIYSGATISFVESQHTFVSNIREVKPTHFFGVPRIWEKIQSNILAQIGQTKLSKLLKIPFISGIVRYKIKRSLGLDKAKVILSGAAPLSAELLRWYLSLGIVIREAYGMSENFNVVSMNPQNDIRPGAVGKLFPNQDILIDPDTQEITQRCTWLMKEYYRAPDLTNESLKNGFLRTGDMGELSFDGFLTITGRVKDIFKTSKGEYISPSLMEMKFLDLPSVDQACVVGSIYSQPVVLIVLSEWGKSLDNKVLENQIKEVINKVNDDNMEYQQLKKAIIVKEEWTPDNELLTPSLKMKRTLLSKKYEKKLAPIVDQLSRVSWE